MWVLLAYLIGHKRGRRGRPFRPTDEERRLRHDQFKDRRRNPMAYELPSRRPRPPYVR